MRIVLSCLLAMVLGSAQVLATELQNPESNSAVESAGQETLMSERDAIDDWNREFYICQAFNSEGFIVAMQMGRDQALARVKTWEICVRNKLDCYLVQCYEQF
jgi:hypothetical protein